MHAILTFCDTVNKKVFIGMLKELINRAEYVRETEVLLRERKFGLWLNKWEKNNTQRRNSLRTKKSDTRESKETHTHSEGCKDQAHRDEW